MLQEICAAVSFITSFLKDLNEDSVNKFSTELKALLEKKYTGHWYPEEPLRGLGFRCLHDGYSVEPIFKKAAKKSGININDVSRCLPEELYLWINPREVCYRKGKPNTVYKVDLSLGNHNLNPNAPSFKPVNSGNQYVPNNPRKTAGKSRYHTNPEYYNSTPASTNRTVYYHPRTVNQPRFQQMPYTPTTNFYPSYASNESILNHNGVIPRSSAPPIITVTTNQNTPTFASVTASTSCINYPFYTNNTINETRDHLFHPIFGQSVATTATTVTTTTSPGDLLLSSINRDIPLSSRHSLHMNNAINTMHQANFYSTETNYSDDFASDLTSTEFEPSPTTGNAFQNFMSYFPNNSANEISFLANNVVTTNVIDPAPTIITIPAEEMTCQPQNSIGPNIFVYGTPTLFPVSSISYPLIPSINNDNYGNNTVATIATNTSFTDNGLTDYAIEEQLTSEQHSTIMNDNLIIRDESLTNFTTLPPMINSSVDERNFQNVELNSSSISHGHNTTTTSFGASTPIQMQSQHNAILSSTLNISYTAPIDAADSSPDHNITEDRIQLTPYNNTANSTDVTAQIRIAPVNSSQNSP